MISSIVQSDYGSLYNPENIYVSSDGGGAGNNWAYGYAQAQKLEEPILDMIEREAEGADNFEVVLPFACHLLCVRASFFVTQ